LAAFKMLGALALVLVCLYALYYLMKRLNTRNAASGNNALIRILETKSLGLKKQLAVLEVMGEFFLLGISGDALTVLSRIRPEGMPADGVVPSTRTGDKGFGAYLGKIAGKPAEGERT
jgi:flagellar biogenesis protein FliO